MIRILIELGNHPAVGILVAALSVLALFCLELRTHALGRTGWVNQVLGVAGLNFAILSCLFMLGHFLARIGI